MTRAMPKVRLIAFTPDAQTICAAAARMCYSSASTGDVLERARTNPEDYLEKVMSSGHLSVVEHASFTFAIEGVSRAFLAQITRHRLASYSVQSQRYVSLADGFRYVLPPRIAALGDDAVREYERQMASMHEWYTQWQEKLGDGGNEDARFVLPAACETRMIVTMNARELSHFFRLRMCTRAQWEIRKVARMMFREAYAAAPALFEHSGPGCTQGACPEGTRCCGQMDEMRALMSSLKSKSTDSIGGYPHGVL